MSIAIIAFLKNTQTFFVEQRLVWAMIMVAISMTPTAGQSVFQFMLRIGGTAIAMVSSPHLSVQRSSQFLSSLF
jgi:Flp pilus assembly protein protease CpaA